MRIIGITGTRGAGKGTIVDYLVREKGFAHYSARDFIVKEIERRGLPVSRDTMTTTADDLRAAHGPSYVIDKLYGEAVASGQDTVIESLHAIAEVEFLRKKPNFVLFAVDADPHIRYARIQKRKSATDQVSFEKFMADEAREFASPEPHKQNLKACIAMADHRFENNGTVADLEREVEKVLGETGGADRGKLMR